MNFDFRFKIIKNRTMTKHIIKSQTMKTLLIILLFATSFCYAQPAITNPTPLSVCDDPSSFGIGFENFNLSFKDAEILGSLLASNHTVSYHETMTDASIGVNAISSISYTNVNIYNQVVYVRVIENSNPANPAITTLELVVNPLPSFIQPSNYEVNDSPYDGFAVFDLTTKISEISQGSNVIVTFHESLADAVNNTTMLPNSYTNITNPQTIWTRITDPSTGCSAITSFNLIINYSNPFPINNPTPLQVCDDNADGIAVFNIDSKNAEILGSLSSSQYTVTYYENQFAAQLGGFGNILSPYFNITPNNQTVYARVELNSDTTIFSTTSLELIVNPYPIINTPIPNLTVYENPADGIAVFNLGSHSIAIFNGSIPPAVLISFYTSLSDANNQSNPIPNVTSFNGTNGQVIYINVQYPASGCFTVSSFTLSVVDSNLVVYIPDLNFKAKLITEGVDTNLDGEIQFTEAAVIVNLQVSNANISDLTGILSFPLLQNLDCSQNQLTTLNVVGLANLNSFNCSYNQLATLSFSGSNFSTFNCSNNLLTTLTASNVTAFMFNCQNNNLTNLNVSNSSFSLLNCSNNQLSSIDVSTTTILFEFNCSVNQLTSLDVTGKLFGNFMCSNNLLTTLDVSTCTSLTIFQCDSNPLTTLFAKNGRNESISFPNNANLSFICADEGQISMIQAMANTATVVSSFCTFTPGGNYNTITGTVRVDANNNGCDASDLVVPFYGSNVSLDGVSTNSTIFSNAVGVYNLYTSTAGTYQLDPLLENATYFNVSPVAVTIPTIDNTTTTLNICLTPNGIHPDVEVVLAPITPARPGFNASYELVYKNKGNQTLSGTVTLNYNDSVLDYVSASTAPTSQTSSVINWNYSNLQPFENRSIGLVLNVNSPVETPAVNIDDILNFTTTITPIAGDEIPADNTFVYNQTVVGSYDPNDITCLQGDTVSPSEIGNFLHYIINFENTGTYYAENVVVQDIIDTTQYDISSLQILNASHNMDARINGNVVEFVFQNINLAAVAGNPPVGGHGNVLFKIKSKSNLVTGDQVIKKASIFFDYNAPIITNDAETTYTSLNNGEFNQDASLSFFPNPTSSVLNITSDNTIESIELYDIQGRILEKSFQNSNTVTLDISNRQSGIYFLKITSDKGSKVEKVVKK